MKRLPPGRSRKAWREDVAKGWRPHADRGSSSYADACQALLGQCELTSKSRIGHGYENSPMARAWETLTRELVQHRRDNTRRDARSMAKASPRGEAIIVIGEN